MTSDHKSVKCIQIQFVKHPKDEHKTAHIQPDNDAHSLSITEPDSISTDETWTALKPNCINIICDKMFKTQQECAQSENQDQFTVKSMFNGSPFLNQGSESGLSACWKEDMLHTMIFAQEKKPPRITLKIGINHLDFQHKFIAKAFNARCVGIDASNKRTEEIKPPSTPTDGSMELIKTFIETAKQFSNPSRDQNSQHNPPKKNKGAEEPSNTPPTTMPVEAAVKQHLPSHSWIIPTTTAILPH